jgi:hypothetical protein
MTTAELERENERLRALLDKEQTARRANGWDYRVVEIPCPSGIGQSSFGVARVEYGSNGTPCRIFPPMFSHRDVSGLRHMLIAMMESTVQEPLTLHKTEDALHGEGVFVNT